jgi:hypothetical protein
MLDVLDEVPFSFDSDADANLMRELQQFGVRLSTTQHWFRTLRSFLIAAEIESVRVRAISICKDKTVPTGLRSSLAGYFWDGGETELTYIRFLRHLADSITVSDVLKARKNDVLSGQVSSALSAVQNIVCDEGNSILLECRKMIAGCALSRFHFSQGRSTFLRQIGYQVPHKLGVPIWPIVLSFAIVAIGMAVPQVVVYYLRPEFVDRAFKLTTDSGSLNFSGILNLLVVLCNQSFTQSIGVIWATAPKNRFSFARPSTRTLPILSYVVFGALSYFSCVVFYNVIFIANPLLPLAVKPIISSLILSLNPLMYTVVIAMLVDMHLMSITTNNRRGRLVDGVILAMGATVAEGLVIIFVVRFVRTELPLVSFQSAVFVLATMAVGFAIGAIVPRTAARALDKIASGAPYGSIAAGMPQTQHIPPRALVKAKPPTELRGGENATGQ